MRVILHGAAELGVGSDRLPVDLQQNVASGDEPRIVPSPRLRRCTAGEPGTTWVISTPLSRRLRSVRAMTAPKRQPPATEFTAGGVHRRRTLATVDSGGVFPGGTVPGSAETE